MPDLSSCGGGARFAQRTLLKSVKMRWPVLFIGVHEYVETSRSTFETRIDADVVELFLPFPAAGDEDERTLWRPYFKCRDGVQSSKQRLESEIFFGQIKVANRKANLHRTRGCASSNAFLSDSVVPSVGA